MDLEWNLELGGELGWVLGGHLVVLDVVCGCGRERVGWNGEWRQGVGVGLVAVDQLV